MKTNIVNPKTYPPDVPVDCKDRVWLSYAPYCTYETGAAITVTETDVKFAPFCSHKICPLEREIINQTLR